MSLLESIRPLVGPVARILARVLAGFLIGLGFAREEQLYSFLPDIEALLGFALWAMTEWLYGQAKKRGWAT